jgi:DNA-binding MarR family transcriptional regulator
MTKANTQDIAQKTLDIIPLVMTVMASEMRNAGHEAVSPSHVRLLGMLSERPYTLSELADMQQVSAPTMSNTITALEERGWVTRTRSDVDRRVVTVNIAEAGHQVIADIHNHTRARIAEFISPLSEDDLNLLLAGLTILRDAFTEALKTRHHTQDCTPK